MGTSWSEIITKHAMVLISDDRMTEDLQQDAALFFRRMSA